MDKDLSGILNQYKSLYFISPHLDDAIFSCGGLIYELRKNNKIKVINIFTSFDDNNYSKEGLVFLKKSGFKNFSELFKKRLSEDKNIFSELKIKVFNLNLKEFIFQKISLKDYLNNKKIKKYIFEKINNLINDVNRLIFVPYGIGNNPDHLIIRRIIESSFKNIFYYLEWPYIIKSFSEIYKLKKKYHIFEFKKNLFIKEKLIKNYQSQINLLYPDRSLILLKERYLIRKNH